MTLLAGIRCGDGYIIAADTAVTRGISISQEPKIYVESAREGVSRVVVAGAGHIEYARMASEDILKGIRCLIAPTIAEMHEIVRSVIADIYTKQISMFWNGHPDPPDFNLIVALEVSDQYVLLLTSQTSVREVKTSDFCGTGENLAAYLAGMFLLDPQGGRITIPTASAIHIVKEIFRAAKSSTLYVGGSTEIVATRSSKDAQPFFHFQNEGTKEHQ